MSQKIDPNITAVMYRPVLIRAGLALIYGLTTFFVGDPSATVVNYGTAIFFALSGSAMWEYLRRDPVPEGMRTPLSLIAAIWMLAALTLVGVQLGEVSATGTWVVIGAALALSGIAELWAVKWRKSFVLARDHTIPGIAGVITGGLMLGISTDYHRIFGIAGTYAIIVAVMWAISGVGYWLDTRKAVKEDGFEAPAP